MMGAIFIGLCVANKTSTDFILNIGKKISEATGNHNFAFKLA